MGNIEVIILAAGQGTRMRSGRPKVLHEVGGKPMLQHVVDAAKAMGASNIHVVFGYGGDRVQRALSGAAINWVEQAEQMGTGHAVDQAMPCVADDAIAVVLYGDVPLIQPATVQKLVAAAGSDKLALLTLDASDATGLGRIVRNHTGDICRIVEHKDASDAEKQITEINTGVLAARASMLKNWLSRLDNNNVQGEYYITDCVALAVADSVGVVSEQPDGEDEVLGVNSKWDLAQAERALQKRLATDFMLQGLTLRDPSRFDVCGELIFGQDCEVDINVVFAGTVTLGSNVSIGSNCRIIDSEIGDDTTIHPNTIIEGASIASGCNIGPFARIRPETQLSESVRIGNFVEIKKSSMGNGAKANHLAYIGDSEVGKNVNIGAGVITCNYDGANKHKTEIGDGAFIGSNSVLVAPIVVGENAFVAAASAVGKEAPANKLTITRAKKKSIDWQRPVKKAQ
ncbi:MAG: bifunctional UDP-N-acetylglucosamine diphosphorylase/glucosamine-1-phosphate N-acetyltransferase GlmU [Arenicellales bacterium WSBS_2016_MAG_OTU3]